MNTSGNTAKGGDQPAAGKTVNTVNERTYQEVEYLKKNLGPILVAALAEICIRRPADPIEYLGHWLLRWRYNEELKRRDVQNALDVVRQRQWAQVQDETAAIQQEKYASGFTPDQPHGPPGYGGPLSGEELGETIKEVDEVEYHQTEETGGEGRPELAGEGGYAPYFKKSGQNFAVEGQGSQLIAEEHRHSYGSKHEELGPGEERKHSLAKSGVTEAGTLENERKTSQVQDQSGEQRKISLTTKRGSQGQTVVLPSDQKAPGELGGGPAAVSEHPGAEGGAVPPPHEERKISKDHGAAGHGGPEEHKEPVVSNVTGGKEAPATTTTEHRKSDGSGHPAGEH